MRKERVMQITPQTPKTHYMFQIGTSQSVKAKLENPLEHQKKALVHLIHVQEGPSPLLFGP